MKVLASKILAFVFLLLSAGTAILFQVTWVRWQSEFVPDGHLGASNAKPIALYVCGLAISLALSGSVKVFKKGEQLYFLLLSAAFALVAAMDLVVGIGIFGYCLSLGLIGGAALRIVLKRVEQAATK